VLASATPSISDDKLMCSPALNPFSPPLASFLVTLILSASANLFNLTISSSATSLFSFSANHFGVSGTLPLSFKG